MMLGYIEICPSLRDLCAFIEENKNGVTVFPSIRQQSGRLASIKGINGFILVEGGTRIISKGTEVDIEWMDQAR